MWLTMFLALRKSGTVTLSSIKLIGDITPGQSKNCCINVVVVVVVLLLLLLTSPVRSYHSGLLLSFSSYAACTHSSSIFLHFPSLLCLCLSIFFLTEMITSTILPMYPSSTCTSQQRLPTTSVTLVPT